VGTIAIASIASESIVETLTEKDFSLSFTKTLDLIHQPLDAQTKDQTPFSISFSISFNIDQKASSFSIIAIAIVITFSLSLSLSVIIVGRRTPFFTQTTTHIAEARVGFAIGI
jgi:uncharacterized membrane protein YgcG